MSLGRYEVGETFVNYKLGEEIDRAYEAGVFPDKGIENEDEDRHVSELERRMTALDEKEVFITVKTFVEHHFATLSKTLKYMRNKEGEHFNERNIS